MRKNVIDITAVLATAALFMSLAIFSFAAMPAGSPRTRKEKERALMRYVAEMKGRIGQSGGEIGKTVERRTSRLYRAAGQGAPELYKEMDRIRKDAGEEVEKFCTESYRQMQHELRSPAVSPRPIHQRRYAPTDRRGRRGRR